MAKDAKKQMAEAYVALLKEKDLDKISVIDLIEKCGISRQTFYYHFHDMMELIEWAINETLKETLSRSVATGDVRKGLTLFVNNTLRYRVMVKKLMESSKRAQIERVFMQIAEAYFRETLKRWDTCFRSKDDLEFIATFCAYGVTGILLENCHKEEVNKEQLVDQLYHLWTRHFLKYFEENSL